MYNSTVNGIMSKTIWKLLKQNLIHLRVFNATHKLFYKLST